MSFLKVKPAQLTKNGRSNCCVADTVETGEEASIINNIGIQRDDPEEDDDGVEICTSTSDSERSAAPANKELTGLPPVTSGLAPGTAASPVLPCYYVGQGVSLPFGQSLPQCSDCSDNALIAWSSRSDPKQTGVVCLDHGLSDVRDLVLRWDTKRRYRFISRKHEAALRAFLA